MAYGIGYDIVVNDDNCNAVGSEYADRAKWFENILERYDEILQEILDSAVMDGALADNLKKFRQEANALKNETASIAKAAQSSTHQFLADMDSADSYLF